MDKIYVIRFLKEGKRGAYTLLVDMYSEVITSVGPSMALQIITDDLQKESEDKVVLNYSSLAHAIKKYKRKVKAEINVASELKRAKLEFLDAHEIKEKQLTPGRFKLPHVDARKSKAPKSKAS